MKSFFIESAYVIFLTVVKDGDTAAIVTTLIKIDLVKFGNLQHSFSAVHDQRVPLWIIKDSPLLDFTISCIMHHLSECIIKILQGWGTSFQRT